jgi:hypothetical protein
MLCFADTILPQRDILISREASTVPRFVRQLTIADELHKPYDH